MIHEATNIEQIPIWIEYLKALATPTIGATGLIIALVSYLNARRLYRSSMNDKRISCILETGEILSNRSDESTPSHHTLAKRISHSYKISHYFNEKLANEYLRLSKLELLDDASIISLFVNMDEFMDYQV